MTRPKIDKLREAFLCFQFGCGGGGVSKKTFIFVTLRYWCNDTVASHKQKGIVSSGFLQ